MGSKTDKTEIVVLLDRSGSMQTIQSDVVGGLNSYVEGQQAEPGKCKITVIQFDSVNPHDMLRPRKSINKWTPVRIGEYAPRSQTPLLDAMGRAINEVPDFEDDRQVVFVAITDGKENASSEYTTTDIKTLVQRKTDEGWVFVYLGANVDAFAEAGSMGIRNFERYQGDGQGIQVAMASAGNVTGAVRRARSSGTTFSAANVYEDLDVERAAQEDFEERSTTG